MLKQRFLGLPGLCLCFLMCTNFTSCAVIQDSRADAVKGQLELKAWLIPVENIWYLPIDNALMAAPYDIARVPTGYAVTNSLIITYRVSNMQEALALKKKLFETGQVENVIISNYKRSD